MSTTVYVLQTFGTLLLSFNTCMGHGFLKDPPARNSLWRVLPSAVKNYNDNELNCGGFSFQWDVNKGKCGVCGDPYGKTQKHVGQDLTRVITRTYEQGQSIDVTIAITSNHKGWFEFRLGELVKSSITQMQLKHLLKIEGNYISPYRYPLGQGNQDFKIRVKLPDAVSCNHCVLQWWYNAGNNWGCSFSDPSDCDIGKGRQETFVNCADIKIKPRNFKLVTSTRPSTSLTTQTTTTFKKVEATKASTTPFTEHKGIICVGYGIWTKNPKIDAWCQANCPQFCPRDYCICKHK